MSSYNPWPLGLLPPEWQRREPFLIRDLGYSWEDPRDIVSLFEEKLARFSGAKFAVTTDCASHAIFLSIMYCKELDPRLKQVIVPLRTYASVPMQLIHAGLEPVFEDFKWSGTYTLEPTNIIDGAGRFRSGMYESSDSLHILSFQIKKRLPIGRGGAILTNSRDAYEWLKRASYDGRDLTSRYDSTEHIQSIGWHYYMTPEDAARGLWLMEQLPEDLPDTMSFANYPKLTTFKFFKPYKIAKEDI